LILKIDTCTGPPRKLVHPLLGWTSFRREKRYKYLFVHVFVAQMVRNGPQWPFPRDLAVLPPRPNTNSRSV
jgi:hypothetical protein